MAENITTSTEKKSPFPVRLQMAVEACEKYTKPMRENRQKILQRYAAGWYEDRMGSESRPINMIYRYHRLMIPFLSQRIPRSMVKPTGSLKLNSQARVLEMAMNHLKKEIAIDETYRTATRDSLSYMGMTKTGKYHAGEVEIGGETHQIGQVYCDPIDGDDIRFDIAAKRKAELMFYGHQYYVPVQYLTDSGLFKNYGMVKPATKLYGSESPDKISKGEADKLDYFELYDYVKLYDLWLPNEGLLVTLPERGQGQKFLRTVDEFPDDGPFDFLYYNDFPNTFLPIPPAYSILDLDDQLNRLARRIDRQANREKTILAYEGKAADDAGRVVGSSDGEAVQVNNLDRIKEISYGGVNQNAIPVAEWLRSHLSEQGGNLDNLGGMRSEAGTLGQEQIISGNARGPVDDMANQTQKFMTSIDRKLAWYLWYDPTMELPMIRSIPGLGEIEVKYSDETKEGDFLDFSFDIVPYSFQGMSPEMAYQKLLQVTSQMVMPLVQVAAAQGLQIDVQRIASLAGQYLDVQDFDSLFIANSPQSVNMGPYDPNQKGQISGKAKSGQPDGRLGQDDGMANMNQQQARASGQSTAGMESE
jgi:hypothetical protein